jgi:hypothetical protein
MRVVICGGGVIGACLARRPLAPGAGPAEPPSPLAAGDGGAAAGWGWEHPPPGEPRCWVYSP